MFHTLTLRFARGTLVLVLLIASQTLQYASGYLGLAPATTQTRVFQQGLDGYAGVRDTWISAADWDSPPQHTVNYGQNKTLVLSRDGDDNPLLRFDLSSIPANSAVISATLSLYNTTQSSWSGTRDFARRVRLFRMLRDWDEGDPGDPGSTANVIHSTVATHNCSTWPGGNGLLIERNSQVTVKNSIFWGHGGDDFWVDATSTLSVTYTTSGEAIAGAGNLTSDPLFADATGGDYHLRSTAGRWDPAGAGGSGAWVVDASHSPAIDAGDPASDHSNEPSPNGGRANMGAYGSTAEASKSSEAMD